MKTSKNFIHSLSIHLVFVIKYRKKLLIKYGDEIKKLLMERSDSDDLFDINHIEVDKDHVHMMIDFYPTETITNIVRKLKSYTVHNIWQRHEEDLIRQFWKNNMFWSRSYFVCSVGDCSRETIENYINNQGGKERYRHES